MIFVGGVHGAGKSFICKKISETLKIESISASNLIKNASNCNFGSSKKSSNLDENQNILIEEILKRKSCSDEVILDGHFCLLAKNGHIYRVNEDVFSVIDPKAIIVVYNEIKNIMDSLKKKDEDEYSEVFINEFQQAELEYSKNIAEKLKIPYMKLMPSQDIITICGFLRDIR